MRLVLFQPDIPQNVGACIRLSACFGVPLDVIRPTGFALDDRSMKRAALDYGPLSHMALHDDWDAYCGAGQAGRLILFTTKAARVMTGFDFQTDDRLLFGRETAGVPDFVHQAADERLFIPIRPETRSLNLATSAAITLFEALRQTEGLRE